MSVAGLEAMQRGSQRAIQREWAARPLAERLRVIRAFRHRLAEDADALVRAAAGDGAHPERSAAEVLTAEVIPLADACRFLEREAPRVLAPRLLGSGGRPAWLGRVVSEVRREPLGTVLILAPSNYPLYLPGVQALQALTAGNAVLWKPGRSGQAAARRVSALLAAAGLPPRLLTVLPEAAASGRSAIAAGVDKVLLTGSAATGRKVLAQLAPRLIPLTAELSGCDALFVLPAASAADLERAARAIRFGLALNGGATCIAPRRVFVPAALAGALERRVAELAAALPAARIEPQAADRVRRLAVDALARGARRLSGDAAAPPGAFPPLVLSGVPAGAPLLREDLFAPVVSLIAVAGVEEALAAAAGCPCALGAAIFGPEEAALALAGRVRAGMVVVNDVIVPTADPRLPFGGRGESGFGVTRGAEGLLELTAVKTVAVRRGRWLPHLDERRPGDEEIFRGWLAAAHGAGLRGRIAGAARLMRALGRRGRSPQTPVLEEVRG